MLFEEYRNEPFSDFTDARVTDEYRAALAAVEKELGQDYPLVIGGEEVTTGNWIESFDPGEKDRLLGRAAAAGSREIEKAYDAAEAAFRTWSAFTMEDRARALMRLAAVMRRRKRKLSAWLTFEAGKNWAEADGDVAEAIDFVEYYARQSLKLAEPVNTAGLPGEENTTYLKPIGTGVAIPPWNFPLAIMVGTAIGPAAVGNTMIIKPSPNTPLIAGEFMRCVAEAGFPPGVLNLLTGTDEELGDALVDNVRTRFINFTGSVGTGLRIHQRAAELQPGQNFIKKVYAEMGGKDAIIVDETADLDLAADAAVASAFGFNGQKCSAASRLITVPEIHDELLEKVLERTRQLSVGHASENADVGAVISERQFDSIMRYIETGKQEAKLLLGGEAAEGNGWYIKPTVFDDVKPSATIACEEIFGPVLAVMPARDFDHAIELFNSTRYALTGGICSRSAERLNRARRELEVGNLYINRKITGALVGVQPFGGYRLSGDNAKAGGPDYLRLFMLAYTITERF